MPFNETLHDAGVDFEEVVTGHARFARDSGGNDDDVGVFEGFGHAIVGG